MKEHLVALVYILLIAGVCFAVMARPMTARLMTRDDFALRRNLFLAVTVATFLAHNYWLAMLACALIVGIGSRFDRNPVALYCALLFAVPQFDMAIPGFGVINQLFEINHPRLLALVLLLPAAIRLIGKERPPMTRLRVADVLFAMYFIYVFIATATVDTITGLMRGTVNLLLDHGLLYYVITRTAWDRRRFMDTMASFVMGLAVVGTLGGFETVRNWLLYESLRVPLGIPLQTIGTYLLRETEDGGYLRAYVTTGHAIALGFMSMIVLTWQLALVRSYRPRLLGYAVILMLLVGLLASVSRGPWLACAIGLAIGSAFGPGAKRRLLVMGVSLPLAVGVLLMLPQGQKFIDLLPFIGTVEPGSVTYRTQLIERAMIVFWQNPIFGSLQFIHNPVLEVMRQGQGIIDIVNSYVGVALAYGAVGLLLFVLPSAYALVMSWTTSRRMARQDVDAEAVGRALAASMVSIMLAIGAVSHYFHIPVVHWLVVSLCVGYVAHAPNWRRAPVVAPQGSAAAGALPQRRGALAGRPARRHA
jgi:hypothetical protein